MPIQMIRDDITRVRADAIVSAAGPHLQKSGAGVHAAILKAAGSGLEQELKTLENCGVGQCRITGGYNLPCRFVIHTVGPVWQGGYRGEDTLLASCYQNCLQLAAQKGCRSIAFPLISTGHYGFPREEALEIAMRTIEAFLHSREEDMDVTLVIYDDQSYFISSKLYSGIEMYIDARYVIEHGAPYRDRELMNYPIVAAHPDACTIQQSAPSCEEYSKFSREEDCFAPDLSLERALSMVDESFSRMVLRKIDEKGMKDADCYKRANLDRKHFSKIRSDEFYRPKKTTAMALAIALRLSRQETDELLLKAGYALSRSSRMDIILEYCIEHRIYDINEVNSILFSFDQPTLGV